MIAHPTTPPGPLRPARTLAGLGLALLLAACGGSRSSGTASAAPLAPGIFTSAEADGTQTQVLLQSDGTTWIQNTLPDGRPVALGTGKLQATNGAIPSSTFTLYSLPGATLPDNGQFTIQGTYTQNQVNVTTRLGTATESLELKRDTTLGAAPALATVMGTYAGPLALLSASEPVDFVQPALTLTVGTGGTLTGTLSRAAGPTEIAWTTDVTGTLTPRTDLPCFDLVLNFAPPPGSALAAPLGTRLSGICSLSDGKLLFAARNGSAAIPFGFYAAKASS